MGQSNIHKMIVGLTGSPPRAKPPTIIASAIGTTFERDGRKWRVTATTDTFLIGTAVSCGERGPIRASDIIKVMK